MQVAVWDTYVTKSDGTVMHFDIIAPENIKDEKTIHTFGKEYLLHKSQEKQQLTTKECVFCHIEKATNEIETSILEKGYYILEMQNCN
jgi:Ni,Fe-hydrogenase maturation factor